MSAGERNSRAGYRITVYPMVVKRPREYIRIKRKGRAVTRIPQDSEQVIHIVGKPVKTLFKK